MRCFHPQLVPHLAFVLTACTASIAAAAEPQAAPPQGPPELPHQPEKGLLFRGDLSFVPGYYVQNYGGSETNDDLSRRLPGQQEEVFGTLGPALALNLGFAPSKLIRLGLAGSAAVGANFYEDRASSGPDPDGLFQWSVGPTVGFRFGPRVPLELEVGLHLTSVILFGSNDDGSRIPEVFRLGESQYGVGSNASLIWRPGGADSEFGVHVGLRSAVTYPSYNGDLTTYLGSAQLGLSLGL